MATVAEDRTSARKFQNRAVSFSISRESTCSRCEGLMVSDRCMDLLNSTGELEFAAKRCVQCGEVVDPVIQRNRQLRQQSTAVQFVERKLSPNGEAEAR